MRWDQVKAYSFRNAPLVYVTLSFGLTVHDWLLGQVVPPYRHAGESAAPETSGALQIESKGVADLRAELYRGNNWPAQWATRRLADTMDRTE